MNVSTERVKAVVTLVVDVLLAYNMLAAAKGWTVVPAEYDTIYEFVSAAALIVAGCYTWWKNQNVTEAACVAQETIDALKEADKSKE